jgi:hypothetical protein
VTSRRGVAWLLKFVFGFSNGATFEAAKANMNIKRAGGLRLAHVTRPSPRELDTIAPIDLVVL